MRSRNTRRWAETVVAAALNDRDIMPILELAGRAGVDVDELTRVVNCVFETAQQYLVAISEPEELLTIDDFNELKKLGIAAN